MKVKSAWQLAILFFHAVLHTLYGTKSQWKAYERYVLSSYIKNKMVEPVVYIPVTHIKYI
jgi:hypothetical protein